MIIMAERLYQSGEVLRVDVSEPLKVSNVAVPDIEIIRNVVADNIRQSKGPAMVARLSQHPAVS